MLSYRERLSPSPWIALHCLLLCAACTLVFAPINFTVGIVIGIVCVLVLVTTVWFTGPIIEVHNGGTAGGAWHDPTQGARPRRTADRATGAARAAHRTGCPCLPGHSWLGHIARESAHHRCSGYDTVLARLDAASREACRCDQPGRK